MLTRLSASLSFAMKVELKRSPHRIGRKIIPAVENTALLEPPPLALEPQGKADDSKASANAMFANLFLLFFGSGTFAMPWGSPGRVFSEAQ